MSLRLELGERLEEKFRKAAMETYGYEKGSLKKAAQEAFESWISRKQEGVKEVENPVKLIEGIFSSLKGKYTSVQLQHEAKDLWTKSIRQSIR